MIPVHSGSWKLLCIPAQQFILFSKETLVTLYFKVSLLQVTCTYYYNKNNYAQLHASNTKAKPNPNPNYLVSTCS